MPDAIQPYVIHQGDCRDLLKEAVPKESIQLFFTSPPYAQGKEYERGLDWDGLWLLMAEVACASYSRAKDGGFFVVNFGETTKYTPRTMTQLYTDVFTQAGWLMHSRRVWAKQYARCRITGLQNVHTIPVAEYEHLFTFRKPPNDRERIRHKLSYRAVWSAKGTAKYGDHPATFPPDLAASALAVWTDEGDLVCDPFAGVGSTGVACLEMQRRFIGMELEERWAQAGRDRLRDVQTRLGGGAMTR